MSDRREVYLRFNGGEMDDHALARIDLDEIYAKGCERMENIFPLLTGGMTRAPGTRHIGAAGNVNVVLRPFVFSEGEAWCLEWTPMRLRLLENGGLLVRGEAIPIIPDAWQDLSVTTPTGGGAPPSGGSTPIMPGGGGVGDEPLAPGAGATGPLFDPYYETP